MATTTGVEKCTRWKKSFVVIVGKSHGSTYLKQFLHHSSGKKKWSSSHSHSRRCSTVIDVCKYYKHMHNVAHSTRMSKKKMKRNGTSALMIYVGLLAQYFPFFLFLWSAFVIQMWCGISFFFFLHLSRLSTPTLIKRLRVFIDCRLYCTEPKHSHTISTSRNFSYADQTKNKKKTQKIQKL